MKVVRIADGVKYFGRKLSSHYLRRFYVRLTNEYGKGVDCKAKGASTSPEITRSIVLGEVKKIGAATRREMGFGAPSFAKFRMPPFSGLYPANSTRGFY